MLHNNAAQQRHGEKPAAKGVTNHTTGTRTSIHPDSNPQATQPTRRHTSCKPNRREHGHAHHPHPRRAQPASAIGPYDPCKTANATAAIWPGGNARAQFRALTLACTTPSPRGGYGQPARSSDLSRGQSKECYPGMRHRKLVPSQHKETPGNTQATATAQYTHSTLLKSSKRPMTAARRRQGQQLYAWHGTPSRRPQAAPPFPLTPADEAIQPQPPALPPEVWPCECNTNKTRQSKRDKVFLNTTHC